MNSFGTDNDEQTNDEISYTPRSPDYLPTSMSTTEASSFLKPTFLESEIRKEDNFSEINYITKKNEIENFIKQVKFGSSKRDNKDSDDKSNFKTRIFGSEFSTLEPLPTNFQLSDTNEVLNEEQTLSNLTNIKDVSCEEEDIPILITSSLGNNGGITNISGNLTSHLLKSYKNNFPNEYGNFDTTNSNLNDSTDINVENENLNVIDNLKTEIKSETDNTKFVQNNDNGEESIKYKKNIKNEIKDLSKLNKMNTENEASDNALIWYTTPTERTYYSYAFKYNQIGNFCWDCVSIKCICDDIVANAYQRLN